MRRSLKTTINAIAILWIAFATINILEIADDNTILTDNSLISYAYAADGCKSNCSGCEFNSGSNCLDTGDGDYCGKITDGEVMVECYKCDSNSEDCDQEVEG